MREGTLAAVQTVGAQTRNGQLRAVLAEAAAAAKIALFASLFGFLTAGCAGSGGDMVKADEVDSVLVQWRKVAPEKCGGVQHAYGCATVSHKGALCVIELPEDAPDWALAHEFKHCFGYVHKHGGRPDLAALRNAAQASAR